MDNWDDKTRKLVKEFQTEAGELKDPIKIAILTNMLPTPIQEHIFTHVQKTASYDDVAEMVRTFVMNKLSMGSTVTQKMDMGNAEGDIETPPGFRGWHDHDGGGCGGYGDENNINAISDMVCHQCGGVGHLRRDCPTKGQGKGKDGPKGSWGGNHSGGPKGFQGGSKGFQGGKDYGKGSSFGKG